jgi:hypothetical protein
MTPDRARQLLLQADWLKEITESYGRAGWLPVYRFDMSGDEWPGIFSALIPPSVVNDVLSRESWELQAGDGAPRIVTNYRRKKPVDQYARYGRDDGIEPLVLRRSFHGIKPAHFELTEEFRLYLNLYDDRANQRLLRINDAGDEEEVVRFRADRVEVRTRELREFINVKQMHLALFFDITRFVPHTLGELGLEEREEPHRSEGLSYCFIVRDMEHRMVGSGRKTMSRLIGKKLIAPKPRKSGELPIEPEYVRGTEEFIIGVDEDGKPIRFTSDPDKLANYFGANPGAPHYLTPVFFRREVLGKYYGQPEKYSVADGQLRCGALWSLRLDNNHDKYVVAFLGDLGRDLPASEQGYWKSFNVLPDGPISEVAFRRGFLAEWTDAQRADLVFKATFSSFQQIWEKKFGWQLFRPLEDGDTHLLDALHVPLAETQIEFDGQVLALAKVLVDSLNEEALSKAGITLTQDMKGISKLAAFLELQQFAYRTEVVQFLRDLYSLRSSGSGHRKGSGYQKAAIKFGIPEVGLVQGFEDILEQATEVLNRLSLLAE